MYRIDMVLMRAGTSKALFINRKCLPISIRERNNILLKLMGSPEIKQIDGMGNGDALSNKIAIVSQSVRNDADVDFLFAQIVLPENKVSTEANCGNILSGVAPYAIDMGIIRASRPTTSVRIYNENTDTVFLAVVATPNGKVKYEGDFYIDGVPGTGSPIYITFSNSCGKTFGTCMPTNNPIDVIDGIKFSFIDVAIPVIFICAESLGKTGYESKEELTEDTILLNNIKNIREKVLSKYNLPESALLPKVALLSAPKKGGHVTSRYFTPYSCHAAHAITGGLCLAAACFMKGSIANDFYAPKSHSETIVIEHPAGKLVIDIELMSDYPFIIKRARFMRTARPLFEGFGIIA